MTTTTCGASVGLVLAAALTAHAATFTVSPGESISDALASASAGDSVLVAAGTYGENLVLVDGVLLLGGYDLSFDDANRDPAANRTVVQAGGTGPAVRSGPSVEAGTVVDGFVLTGGGGTPGAGILVEGGGPVFSNNEISGNRRSGIAGGAYVFGGSTALFDNNLFLQNSSQGSGGGIRIEQSSARIFRNTFDGCVAPNGGGALYVFQSAVSCSGNTFRHCRAGDSGGGGAYFQDISTTASVLRDNVFEDCTASYGGGVMIRDDSFVVFDGNSFDGCAANRGPTVDGFGGGVAVTNFCDVSFQDTRFSNCTADLKGGGLFARESTIEFRGTDATATNSAAHFLDCSADSGGGLYVFDCSDGVFSDTRVTRCDASYGGGLFFDTSGFMITENVIEDCTAVDGGGVVFFTPRPPNQSPPVSDFLNNTIYNCATQSSGGNPGGGILHQSNGFQSDIATIAGTIVAGTPVGSCIRCRGVASQASRPTIHCSSFEKTSTNTADTIGNPQCVGAVNAGINNLTSDDGYAPEFCNLMDFYLVDNGTNEDVGSNCATALSGRANRGVTDMTCPGLLTAIEEDSWGEIKARYRSR